MIDVEIRYQSVTDALRRLEQATAKRRPLMNKLADLLFDAVEENFKSEGRPQWAGLKAGSLMSRAGALTKTGKVSNARFEKKVRGAKILQSSGALLSSISQQSDASSAQVGSKLKYAAIHQFGGKTAAHVIRPRRKKALAWAAGRHPVKSVNHPGSVIPARPFLHLTAGDEQKIIQTVEDYLRDALGA